MILEVAILDVIPNQEKDFESAFAEASGIISSMPGYVSHQLRRCVEKQNRYILLANWEKHGKSHCRVSRFGRISGVAKTSASFL